MEFGSRPSGGRGDVITSLRARAEIGLSDLRPGSRAVPGHCGSESISVSVTRRQLARCVVQLAGLSSFCTERLGFDYCASFRWRSLWAGLRAVRVFGLQLARP